MSAGCGSSIAITVSQPGYEMPSIPTRPLLPGTCASSQSIVSYASVLSSTALETLWSRGGRIMTKRPSEV